MVSKKTIGAFIGIAAFAIIVSLPTPDGMSPEAKGAAAVVVLMSIWWITEAIPVYVTAFIPLVLYPPMNILSPSATAANYGHNYALMFLAVFFLAKAIETQNLHKRIALSIIHVFGNRRQKIILSMMIATALVSMWIANVTTALMMLPIGLSIISKDEEVDKSNRFAPALMLSIAYSASVGGLTTLIGSPTNMIFVGIFEKMFPEAPPVNFFVWLKIGVPILLILIPVFWLYIIKYFKIGGSLSNNMTVIKDELKALGKMKSGEKRVMYIAALTVFAWVFKDDLVFNELSIPGWTGLFGIQGRVHDGTIAMASAIILFLIPADKEKQLITWKEASQVPWGVVMIVGGGYAVAAGFVSTGLADWLGDQLSFISGFSFFYILLIVMAFVLMFTEFNSNTASANILLPILASTAVAASVNPLLIMIPATVACSCAFMMPAATGPNTVVLASERVSIAQMVKCGVWLNLITLVLLTLILYFIIIPWLDLEMTLPIWAQ
ncbi:MAG TPA: SLC13 family permease [Fulvivirga sp.]|nr:SLC13 family permease [Fulvivirga sp.]